LSFCSKTYNETKKKLISNPIKFVWESKNADTKNKKQFNGFNDFSYNKNKIRINVSAIP
jgi:hypothetical protein